MAIVQSGLSVQRKHLREVLLQRFSYDNFTCHGSFGSDFRNSPTSSLRNAASSSFRLVAD